VISLFPAATGSIGVMKSSNFRYVATVLALSLIVFAVTSVWCVHHVYVWAKDLPNRIQIKFDGQGVGELINESVRVAVRDGDVSTQIESLSLLRDGIHADPAMGVYMQQNLVAEIVPLMESPNSTVAALAFEIAELAGFSASSNSQFDQDSQMTNPAGIPAPKC
jgi:hypothetical protein